MRARARARLKLDKLVRARARTRARARNLRGCVMRYLIGIDLGTTNSSVAYVDIQLPNLAIQPFRVHQLVSEGRIEALPNLPSFYYAASQHEWSQHALDIPWKKNPDYFVGTFARDHGARVPTRLIQSAKSWLCHSSANRREKILPLNAADQAQRISPIEATARYLEQIKESWNHAFAQNDPENEFEVQEIILTVPASFDEVARTLTIEAAKQAGFSNMTLLEEPQAAFYSWLSQHEKNWNQQLKAGESILVCDVGGGTTDFSLMTVVEREGQLSIQRMAVGDHLLLGGDNMDAAIAHFLEQKTGRELSTTQWLQLCHEARKAKEYLLASSDSNAVYKIAIQGSGSAVISGSILTEINRTELEKLLSQGFFGDFSWNEALQLHKAKGLRSMGLPYEDDPSIIKHLATFLNESSSGNIENGPDYLLFNGGTMKAACFQQAVLHSLNRWFPKKHVTTLPSASLDYAVSRGAAYYGKARRGLGVKIGGGMARGYYLGVNVSGAIQALTLLPRGSEEGTSYEPETTFWLIPNTPVSFQLYHSHTRLHDRSGDLVAIDPVELQTLPSVNTVLRFGKQETGKATTEKIPVHLGIRYTAIGTLELWLKSQNTSHQWALEFQLRSSSGQDNTLSNLNQGRKDEILDSSQLQKAKEVILETFTGSLHPKQTMEVLEKTLQLSRQQWSLSVLRALADALLLQGGNRKRSVEHTLRWWNLAGFFLRPGYGFPLDDYRLKEFWKVLLGELKGKKSQEEQIQQWICYRRIAGGLNKGQQAQLSSEILPTILKSGAIAPKGKGEIYSHSEKIRVLGAFELLDVATKIRLGDALIDYIVSQNGSEADFWTIGRLGARHLAYGSFAHVVPPEVAMKWINKLLTIQSPHIAFIIGNLARKTDRRDLNVSQQVIDSVLRCFAGGEAEARLKKLLLTEAELTQEEQNQVFGEQLPHGLTIG